MPNGTRHIRDILARDFGVRPEAIGFDPSTGDVIIRGHRVPSSALGENVGGRIMTTPEQVQRAFREATGLFLPRAGEQAEIGRLVQSGQFEEAARRGREIESRARGGGGTGAGPAVLPEMAGVDQLIQQALAVLNQPVTPPEIPSELPESFAESLAAEEALRREQIARDLELSVLGARARAAASGGPSGFLVAREQEAEELAGLRGAQLTADLAFREQQFRADLAAQARQEAFQQRQEQRLQAATILNAAGILSDRELAMLQVELQQETAEFNRQLALEQLELERQRLDLERRRQALAGQVSFERQFREDLVRRIAAGEELTADERALLGLPAGTGALTDAEIRELAASAALRDPRASMTDVVGEPIFDMPTLIAEWEAFFRGEGPPPDTSGTSAGGMVADDPTLQQLQQQVEAFRAIGLSLTEIAQELRRQGWSDSTLLALGLPIPPAGSARGPIPAPDPFRQFGFPSTGP